VGKTVATLQQIARSAGTSKATLYRIAPTREILMDLVMERASEHLEQALTNARLDEQPYIDALTRLTDNVVRDWHFYLFWNAANWVRMLDAPAAQDETPALYGDALEAFFLKGQRAGVFRIDMSAKWLAKVYDFMLYAAVDSAQRGEIGTVGLTPMVLQVFLEGAREPLAPASL
jgi:TetR/AcrR family transcriptional repressor of mexCD-oprJ operon